MLYKKIAIAAAFLFVIQGANYIIWQYFPSLTVINNNASWGINISILWLIALIFGAFITLCVIGAFFDPPWPLPIFLIMSGGVSNIIDRIAYGGVLDYIDIKIIPVFNLADFLITIASAWLVILLVKSSDGNKNLPT